MARPKPVELLTKFFPELIDKTVAASNKEASKELDVRICEAIMSDMIRHFDTIRSYLGDGAIILNLLSEHVQERQNYVNKFMMEQDLKDAEENKDTVVIEFCKDALNTFDTTDFKKEICFILIDKSGGSILKLPRENPAKRIEEMMSEL
ncbi:MAG: hypothetical protein CMB76_06550 [Euryarchaeota archaeon]|nr:hypothetical protein [Euryarchaeota archaeon]|tara:strand:- start:3877 stop:4323 length:447 start_codon:yes stop_codon:yes gene_type:complete